MFSPLNPKTGHLDYGTELWTKAIRCIEQPRLKLQLISAFMTKINRKEILLTPKTIYEHLLVMEKNFDSYFDDSAVNNLNNNTSKIENQNASIFNQFSTKYPFLSKKSRRSKSALSNETHVELLLMAFDAYTRTFHLKEIGSLNHQAQIDSKITGNYELNMTKEPNLKTIDENEMKKFMNSASFENRVNEYKSCTLYGFEVHYESIQMYDAVSIVAVKLTQKYLNDSKYFDLIVIDSKKTLPKLRAKFGNLFTSR